MQKIGSITLIVMIIMAILSLTNLFGLNVAGLSVILGVIYFFINKNKEKLTFEESGLNIKTIIKDLKNKKIWLWFVLPLIMDIISITIGVLFISDYVEYEATRAGAFVSFEIGITSIIQFAILALGEEIAWRAFFQRQLNKAMSITPVLIISSILFALGHWTVLPDFSINVVVYNIFFVFINSVLYGVIAYKSNNAWVSALSHFIANVSSVIIMVFFL